MTKAEKIMALEMMMPTLSEDVISAFMTLARVNHDPLSTRFDFTPDQLSDLAQSRADFKNGRTMTLEEVEASIDTELFPQM